jgi:hypothetical protein
MISSWDADVIVGRFRITPARERCANPRAPAAPPLTTSPVDPVIIIGAAGIAIGRVEARRSCFLFLSSNGMERIPKSGLPIH